jgi:hypothetical protein
VIRLSWLDERKQQAGGRLRLVTVDVRPHEDPLPVIQTNAKWQGLRHAGEPTKSVPVQALVWLGAGQRLVRRRSARTAYGRRTAKQSRIGCEELKKSGCASSVHAVRTCALPVTAPLIALLLRNEPGTRTSAPGPHVGPAVHADRHGADDRIHRRPGRADDCLGDDACVRS